MSYGAVTVQRVTKPALRITQADKLALFALDLLGAESGIRFRGDEITLYAENGILKYQVLAWEPVHRALGARLIFSTVEGITP